jgi:hypothetical protein
MNTENENIGLYLTLYSKPYYSKILNIVKELEALEKSKIYIYGKVLYSLIKQSYSTEYQEPDCVDLWIDTDKSINDSIAIKINDIYFNIVNNKLKPQYELYINTDGTLYNTSNKSVQTVINDIIYS